MMPVVHLFLEQKKKKKKKRTPILKIPYIHHNKMRDAVLAAIVAKGGYDVTKTLMSDESQ